MAARRRQSGGLARRHVPRADQRTRRGFGRGAGERNSRPLPQPWRGRQGRVLPDAGGGLRSRPHADRERDRPSYRHRRRSGRGRGPLRLRAAPAGAVPAPEQGARRHSGAGGDARRSRRGHARRPRALRARPRFPSPVRLLVQPRLSGAAADRLVLSRVGAGEDHPLRGGARDPRLGRPEAPHRFGRPALLRVLPSGPGRRAPDLRRGRADADGAGRDRAAARRAAGPYRRGQGPRRDLLLDLELPGRAFPA